MELDHQKEVELFKKKASAHNKQIMKDINDSFKSYFLKKKKTKKNKA